MKRIFRTDLASLASSNMKIEQKPKNLQTKKDINILSNLTQKRSPNQSGQNLMSQSPNLGSSRVQAPNTKRQPIKVEKKIGRNESCPCGSGKKYKKCHG